MKNDYLTTTEAAKILHVTRFTVLNWVKQGKLAAVATLGGHQRIPKQSIDQILHHEQVVTQAPAAVSTKAKAVPVTYAKQFDAAKTAIVAQKAKVSRMFKRGAYVSGKYLASVKEQISHIVL
ncbi:MAG: excisionase family DNA-binding protein [Candidatus Omnitrophica bacterium]|nr:excisionase family DNA-binding protein [Candidatus Omnitrophota bacterium]